MPIPSEYHVFRKGVKPMWEDEYNAKGGKLSIRVKKEYSNRLWEDLVRKIFQFPVFKINYTHAALLLYT